MEKQTKDFLLRTNQSLHLLATGNSLETILDDVVGAVESQIDESMGAVFILDKTGQCLCLESGPNIPDDFRKATKEFPVQWDACACGKAAFIDELVIVKDLKVNPCCSDLSDVANQYGIRTVWSLPIHNVEGKVLGTFCVYSNKGRGPSDGELILIQSFANIAGIAIQNKRTDGKLRGNEKRFKQLFKQIYSILGETSSFTGIQFIHELIKSLVTRLDVEFAFVGKLIPGEQPSIKTLALWGKGGFKENMEYKLAGTPCDKVVRGQNTIIYKNNVKCQFPADKDLVDLNIESYGAVCLNDANKETAGILVVMDPRPITNPEYIHIILSIFGPKVAAELNRIQIEKEIVKAQEMSEKSNEAKSEFLARMSHELRTPLNAILGFSQLLGMDSEIQESQKKSLSYISSAGEHLLELINEILDLSKIDSGNMNYSLENISLGSFLENLVPLFTPLAKERDIEIKACEAPEGAEVYVFADLMRLKQVLMNLISNGIKYNREGGSVSLDWQEISNSKVRILVNDTGEGMEPEELELAFQPFERLEYEFSVVQGTGIGLSIARRLVSQMNGELSVKSIPGEGSSFFVDLPKGKKPQVFYKNLKEELNSDCNKFKARNKTVLYVEDNAANIELVEEILKSRKIDVVTALTGEEGMEQALLSKPDLILLDMRLPEMNGMDLFKQFKGTEQFDSVPIFALTADTLKSGKQATLEAGFDGYFSKPLEVKTFAETIERALS